jgi:hypothetical protein
MHIILLYSVIPCLVYRFFIVSISKAKLGRELSIQASILLLALEMNFKNSMDYSVIATNNLYSIHKIK